jgi:hypothetical protein
MIARSPLLLLRLALLLIRLRTDNLYHLVTIYTSLSKWICQSPVHHVVEKSKIIQCSVICAMTISALKNVTMKLIRFSGKSISWPKWGHYESSQTTIPKIMSISPIIGE